MKKMLLPIGALGLIFLLSLCNGAAVTRKTLRWQQQILRAQASALQGRWSDAAALLEESHQDWERAQLYLHIVLEHDAIDDAEAMYRRAMAFALAEEPSEFRAETEDLDAQLELLSEMEALSVKNIL